ncbi:VRR-NUC domain-containing protein [Burkholderia vietnamiensis]|uniref:VRR-NUC domain-containing protein n=1 Tax=Burkholderia vietnamiensis TaxID=60552 RepID=UPI001ABADA87|nr:VRR-NUC domain-containing protein [Burkholderia vietnamiensis]
MLEKAVETYLVDRVRAAGGDAYKFTSPQRRSVPDRIVVFPPARIYFVELKRPGNKPTKPQLREHERLRALGCDVRVIDSREAVDTFVREASAPPAPYLYVYEYPSPFGGTHREFSPTTWNGQQPARAAALYVAPQQPAGDKSRADALTAQQRQAIDLARSFMPNNTQAREEAHAVLEALAASPVEQPEKSPAPEGGSEARGRWIQANCPTGDIIKSPSPSNNREFPTSMSELACEHRIALAPSQPAAAPIHPDVLAHIKWLHYCLREAGHCIDGGTCHHECGPKGECWRQDGCVPLTGSRLTDDWKLPAPSPADERAFDGDSEETRAAFRAYDLQEFAARRTPWQIWRDACAWQARAASANETGAEGTKLTMTLNPNAAPLTVTLGPAQAAEPVDIPAGWKFVRVNGHFDALIAALERAESKGYLPDAVREEWENLACDENVAAPQPPAQADARDWLTDEQREAIQQAIDYADMSDRDSDAEALRPLLARGAA